MSGLDALRVQISALSDGEFQELFAWMGGAETMRRAAAPIVEEAKAQVVQEMRESGEITTAPAVAQVTEDGKPTGGIPAWKDPGVYRTKMYRFGDVVRHQGKIVRSTYHGLNPFEPVGMNLDGRAWEELTEPTTVVTGPGEVTVVIPPESGVEPFKQPVGGHDAYRLGEKVLFNGVVYESLIHGNGFSPEAYPQGWRRVDENGVRE